MMDGQLSIFNFLKPQEDAEQSRKDFENKCIKEVIMRGSGFENGKKRIYEMYHNGMNRSEREKAIKEEYGVGGFGKPVHGDGLIGADYSANGLRVDYKYHGDEYTVMFAWKHIEEYIQRFVNTGEYYQPNPCKLDSNRPCNRENLTWIARDLGMKCKSKCCHGCPERKICGAACNQAHE